MYAGKATGIVFATLLSVGGVLFGSVRVQAQAVPTAFQLSAGTDVGHGVLHFDLSWQSSSGNLQDLAQCTIGEYVTYPDPADPFVWPDPAWLNFSTPNPTKLTVPAVDGEAEDNHKPGQFDNYITVQVGFSATQDYWYKCPGTGKVDFPDYTDIAITRNVVQIRPEGQPCAQYTITKLGYQASFIPKSIVTCGGQPGVELSTATHRIMERVSSLADVPSQSLLKITARPVSTFYSLGEPIFVDLQVTNLSSESASLDLGGDGKTNLRVTVTEPDGGSKSVRLPSGGLRASGKHLLGANGTYTERLILNEWNRFREVGDYSVDVALVPEFVPKADTPPTAHLRMRIAARDESKLRAVARTLADQSINGTSVADRGAAALALSYVADPIAVPEMARVLSSGSDAGTALIGALARLREPSALNALQSARSSPNREVRDAAVRALRALRDGKPMPSETAD